MTRTKAEIRHVQSASNMVCLAASPRFCRCRRGVVKAMLVATVLINTFAVNVQISAENLEPEFQSLFDGKTLAGWRGYNQEGPVANWTVEDGAIKGNGEGPDLITERKFGDFELHFEWKLAAGGNSGIIYRVTQEGEKAYHSGVEYQLLDDDHFKEELSTVHSTAAIYGLFGSDNKTLNAADEFNSSKIIARGNHLEHWLNSELIAEGEIDSEAWKTKVAASKFHEWPLFANQPDGHIALQAHGAEVWYRNVRVKTLTSAPKATTDN